MPSALPLTYVAVVFHDPDARQLDYLETGLGLYPSEPVGGARHTALDRQRLIIYFDPAGSDNRPGRNKWDPFLSAARSITMAQALTLGHHRVLGVARRREASLVDRPALTGGPGEYHRAAYRRCRPALAAGEGRY